MDTPTVHIGQRVTVRIGGQVHTLTVGEIVHAPDGRVKFRSITPTDHIWTQMWIYEGCLQ